jgi:hypothetical protein
MTKSKKRTIILFIPFLYLLVDSTIKVVGDGFESNRQALIWGFLLFLTLVVFIVGVLLERRNQV